MREFHEAVRTLPLPIWKIHGDAEAVRDQLWALSRECQQAANLFWMVWLLWHHRQHSSQQIREWLEVPKKERGPFPVQRMPNELSREIYAEIRAAHPTLHTRVIALLMNWLNRTMSSRKATAGNLKGWVAILLNLERAPQYTRPVPIRCDRNIRLEWSDELQRAIVYVRLLSLGAKKPGPEWTFELRSTGKSIGSQIATFRKIVSGEWKLLNTQIAWDGRRKGWSVLVSYQRRIERVAGVNPNKVAHLCPGRKIPFVMWFSGHYRREWLIGKGGHIRRYRRFIVRQIRDRGENYSHASRKRGKGRRPYTDRYAQWWRDFVNANNQRVADMAYRLCLQHGVGKIVYYQPDSEITDRRACTWLGRDNPNDQRTWDYFGLKTKLASKFEGTGIEFVSVKCGAIRREGGGNAA